MTVQKYLKLEILISSFEYIPDCKAKEKPNSFVQLSWESKARQSAYGYIWSLAVTHPIFDYFRCPSHVSAWPPHVMPVCQRLSIRTCIRTKSAENDQIFEWNEDLATVFLKWKDFSHPPNFLLFPPSLSCGCLATTRHACLSKTFRYVHVHC